MEDPRETHIYFPDPRQANSEGLLCYGGDLSVESLYQAYSKGIFPWPQEGYPLLWFSPPTRGILKFADFHIPRSAKKEMAKNHFTVSFDTVFWEVITACRQQIRHGQNGTWILPEMVDAYFEFHRRGYAHSVECWKDGNLVGGLYGVLVNGVFSGESMFHHVPSASKFCLVQLVSRLKAQGYEWIDTQMVTPVLKSFGAIEVERDDFLALLSEAQQKNLQKTFL